MAAVRWAPPAVLLASATLALELLVQIPFLGPSLTVPEIRCLKRYIARELYRSLNTAMATPFGWPTCATSGGSRLEAPPTGAGSGHWGRWSQRRGSDGPIASAVAWETLSLKASGVCVAIRAPGPVEVVMSAAIPDAPTQTVHDSTAAGDRVRKILLACGPLSALVYAGWREIAALQWEGYSRISNSISELSLTGAPSRAVLEPWVGLVYNPLVIAFGIGVWLSARGSRALRVAGGFLILSGSTFPLWMLFGEASLALHLILSAVGILSWFGGMGFAAAAFGRRFRIYTVLTVATMVAFFGLAFGYADEVQAGQPTPFIGLYERIAFSAYFLWQCLFAVALWRRRTNQDGETILEDGAQVSTAHPVAGA